MPQAKAVSLSHFTGAVQSAVKAAVKKHPKFKVEPPEGVTFSLLIRGFPVPDSVLANVTFAETQAFANEVAAQISAQPGLAAEAKLATAGSIFSGGGHIILGIPAGEAVLMER